MASKLNPYLSFDGNAREAMEFYRDALGGELTVNTFGEYGDRRPAPTRSCTATSRPRRLRPDGIRHPARHGHNPGDNISVSLSGDDADQLRGYWEKLSAAARSRAAREADVGRRVRMYDKFGLTWMVNIADASSE